MHTTRDILVLCTIGVALLPSCTHSFAVIGHVSFWQKPTQLFALGNPNKGPRFSQKVHNKKGKKSRSSYGNKNKKKANKVPEAWESGKSIDDLESSMVERWGKFSSPADGAFEMDFGLADDGAKPAKRSKKKSQRKDDTPATLNLRRPVFDPWTKDDGKKPPEGDDQREFYDKDDEVLEEIEWEGDGSGVDDTYDDGSFDTAPKTPGFFFNPSANANRAATQRENERKQQEANAMRYASTLEELAASEQEEGGAIAKPQKRVKPPPAMPVLDEEGDTVLLTVDEAMYRFQSSLVDDGEEVEMDEDSDWMDLDSPLIASSSLRPSLSWEDAGVTHERLLENLEEMECPSPLAVQEKAVPPAVEGKDVLVGTYTGSGKTLAFLTPFVQRLLADIEENDEDPRRMGVSLLIIAPGRELASQIASVARQLIADTGLIVQLSIGGTTFTRNLEQIRKRKPNILVGTPGRVAELVVGKPGEKSGRLKIGDLRALVMDEFDALLEYKPHRDPTQAIMQHLRRRHGDALQSIWCSATASDLVGSSKVKEFLRPGYVEAMADQDDMLVTKSDGGKNAPRVSRTVMHGVVHVPHRRLSLSTVRRILHTEPVPQQILIFVENARKVDIVVERLGGMGILAAALHGGVGSDKMDRAEVSRALREGYVGVVVATELAARGLDAPLLTHVINMDLPTDASHYAHRAGRCGRGGRPGVVINLTTSPKERKVPLKFANALGVELYTAEARSGQLILVDPETVSVS